MGLFKRSGYWHYDFWFNKTRFQGSTRLTNHEKAKVWLNAFKTNLAMGMVGITAKEPPPILSIFLQGMFLDFVRQNCTKPRTIKFYEEKVKVLCAYQPFTMLRLDRIDELAVQGYKDSRLVKKLSPATINGELRTLRKAMIYADRCDLVRYRKARYSVPGEKNRTFILDGAMETRYLAVCGYPLRQVAILMLDLGLRPEEAVGLRKGDISDDAVNIRDGKTHNACRCLPQTQRTREVFQLCSALFPDSEWLFPSGKGDRHYTRGAISNLHTKLMREANPPFPADFKIYNCRHTYGTRLAESGASPFEICYLMGHSSVKVSEKYIHLSPSSVTLAAKRKEAYDRALRGEIHEDSADPAVRRL